MRKNYLAGLDGASSGQKRKAGGREYYRAFLEFLRRPKTVFDFWDRSRLALLMLLAIILLQKVVEFLCG